MNAKGRTLRSGVEQLIRPTAGYSIVLAANESPKQASSSAVLVENAAAAADLATLNSRSSVSSAIRGLDRLLDELQELKFERKDKSAKMSVKDDDDLLEDTVDALTHQMVEALGSEEDVKISQTVKREVTVFGDCSECSLPIEQEASVVGNKNFHPKCFKCQECKKPLGSEQYFIIDGKNYCEKDRDVFLDKCEKCEKVIVGDIIRPRESGRPFHPSCFTCHKCGKEISGKYYDREGKVTCEEDYKKSREKCGKCSEPIMETVLKALGGSFHPACFTCSKCPLCLDGVQFFLDEKEEPMCETCYARHSAKRCSGCQGAIVEDCLVSKNTGGYYHRKCYNAS